MNWEIFEKLNRHKLRYMVLWNYQPLECLASGGDVDLLVKTQDRRKLISLLEKQGWQKRPSLAKRIYHFEMYKVEQEKIYFLDIQTKLLFGGKECGTVKEEKMLEQRILSNEKIYLPDRVNGFLIYAWHLALDKEEAKPKNFEQLNDLRNLLPAELNFINLPKQFDQESLKEFVGRFKFAEISGAAKLWHKIKLKLDVGRSLLRPVKLIVFIGPDGSGKTTQINILKKVSPLFKTDLYLGWDRHFFKPMDKLSRGAGQNLKNKIYYFLYLLGLPIDYFGRYLKVKTAAKYGIILTDRYPLPRFTLKKNFLSWQKLVEDISLRFAYFLLPRPDLVFNLSGDPRRLWQRKPETTYEKFYDNFERCQKSKARFDCKIIEVDTLEPVDNSAGKIYLELLRFLAGSKKRWRLKISPTGALLARFNKKIIKIPLSPGVFREFKQERELIKKIRSDSFFKNYLLDYKYFMGWPLAPNLSEFSPVADEDLIKSYFNSAFSQIKNWPEKELSELIRKEIFLNFMVENFGGEKYNYWENYLKINLPSSSCHGDFNPGNILVKNNKLYFIDWSRFKSISSRYFDLIDYNLQLVGQSWMAAWLNQAKRGFDKRIYEIEVSENHWLAYALWKTADEIFMLKLRNKFSHYKKEKYLNFIKELINYFPSI